jgi:predicted aspartyl protease
MILKSGFPDFGSKPFTSAYQQRVNGIYSDVHIIHAGLMTQLLTRSESVPAGTRLGCQFKGLWDTGATATVITQNVVDQLGLIVVGTIPVGTANGEYMAERYRVSVFLPNHIMIQNLNVTKGNLPSDVDVLIGMDIISQGDFSISNYGGKTVFSYRIPSIAVTDYTQELLNKNAAYLKKIGPNALCPCGSGKKVKQCCGPIYIK